MARNPIASHPPITSHTHLNQAATQVADADLIARLNAVPAGKHFPTAMDVAAHVSALKVEQGGQSGKKNKRKPWAYVQGMQAAQTPVQAAGTKQHQPPGITTTYTLPTNGQRAHLDLACDGAGKLLAGAVLQGVLVSS